MDIITKRNVLSDGHQAPSMRNKVSATRFLCIALMLLLMPCFANYSYAQDSRISLKVENATLGDVISQLEKESKVYFTYNLNQVDVNKTISINATNQTLSQILDQVLAGTDTGYKMEDGHVVLFHKEAPQATKPGQKRTIKGIIHDDKGVPVIGASILEKNTLNGTVTDIDGTYRQI